MLSLEFRCIMSRFSPCRNLNESNSSEMKLKKCNFAFEGSCKITHKIAHRIAIDSFDSHPVGFVITVFSCIFGGCFARYSFRLNVTIRLVQRSLRHFIAVSPSFLGLFMTAQSGLLSEKTHRGYYVLQFYKFAVSLGKIEIRWSRSRP